jgi:selenide,water dikinase
MEAFSILPDPQTNGGLLVAVNPSFVHEVTEILSQAGLQNFVNPVGKLVAKNEKVILVKS